MMRNGCFDRIFKTTCLVQDGYKEVRLTDRLFNERAHLVQNFIEQPFRMTTTCQYDLRYVDKGCEECCHQEKNFKVVAGQTTAYCSTKEQVSTVLGARLFGEGYEVIPLNEKSKKIAAEFIAF